MKRTSRPQEAKGMPGSMPGLQGGAPQASSAAHLLQRTPRSVPVVSPYRRHAGNYPKTVSHPDMEAVTLASHFAVGGSFLGGLHPVPNHYESLRGRTPPLHPLNPSPSYVFKRTTLPFQLQAPQPLLRRCSTGQYLFRAVGQDGENKLGCRTGFRFAVANGRWTPSSVQCAHKPVLRADLCVDTASPQSNGGRENHWVGCQAHPSRI